MKMLVLSAKDPKCCEITSKAVMRPSMTAFANCAFCVSDSRRSDSSHALLFLGVNNIRGTYIRLNAEELCSTANRHDVEV